MAYGFTKEKKTQKKKTDGMAMVEMPVIINLLKKS